MFCAVAGYRGLLFKRDNGPLVVISAWSKQNILVVTSGVARGGGLWGTRAPGGTFWGAAFFWSKI